MVSKKQNIYGKMKYGENRRYSKKKRVRAKNNPKMRVVFIRTSIPKKFTSPFDLGSPC